jgi:hypothetical protein
VGDAPATGQLASLGALAGARRTEEGHSHPQLLRENAPDRERERLRNPS